MANDEFKRAKNNIFVKTSGIILTLLLQEEKWTVSNLSRRSGLSFLHIMNLIKMLEKSGLVATEKGKKFRLVTLTDKGTKIAEKIRELMVVAEEENLDTGSKEGKGNEKKQEEINQKVA